MAPLPPQENPEKKPVPADIPCNCLISSALRHLPHFSSFPRPAPPKPSHLDPTALVRVQNIHASLLSAAERCARALVAAASGNPLLGPLISFRANFHRFCEVRCRNSSGPNGLVSHSFAAILPGDSVVGLVVANGITNFLNLYNTLLVVRLVLTWFPNSPPAIVSPLSTLCDPYLNIFRGIIPPLGGTLDLSPILAFLVLNAFTSTASALPAELPLTGSSQKDLSRSPLLPSNITTMQKKWMRRMCCKGSKNSEAAK